MNNMFLDYGIVLAGHGSRDADGLREFETLVDIMRKQSPQRRITHAYLEFASPTIDQAIRSVIESGLQRIVVVPALLFAAGHAKNDMPSEVSALKQEFPAIEFHYAATMDLHPLLLSLAQQRIIEAEALSAKTVRRTDTCLVVAGRGTSDPDANADVAKLARMLEEGMGFGTSLVCFAGTAKPLVADGLAAASRLGYKRIIVLPYFLFDGVLVKRIYAAADALQDQHADWEVLKAAHLGPHPDVAKVFIERAQEGIEGRAAMNCALCKYRVQIVGFEDQLGLPQQGHHLHVRGLLAQQTTHVGHTKNEWKPYTPHPIEAESFHIIEAGRDWSDLADDERSVAQRLVHTSGDFGIVEDLYFSPGAVQTGIRALLRCKRIVTDVTMVQSGMKRALLEQLGIDTWCAVHDRETHLIAESQNMTRSAAGIRRAWEKWGNDIILAIGDAPTAVTEATRLIREHGWRPQLVIALPVGFVGTQESKDDLRRCMQVPRITNRGTRGGSPWAASVVNALMIAAINRLAQHELR